MHGYKYSRKEYFANLLGWTFIMNYCTKDEYQKIKSFSKYIVCIYMEIQLHS